MARPPHPQGRLPAGLCVFGLTYSCGMTWADGPKANPKPLSARDVIDLAAIHGLSWIELPGTMLPKEPGALCRVRDYGEGQGIRFVYAAGKLRAETLIPEIAAAEQLGAPTVRCTLSGVLCGDRRGFPGGWQAHLEWCARELEQVVPVAEKAGIAVAMENHQDATSDDLLGLCRRFDSPFLGVTLDAGNPLAVMEEPVAFARRVAPFLHHVHLKDYRVHPAPNGFRLARCALGEGVIDFPALLALCDAQRRPITRSIEMAALQARLIPILEPGWWAEYPARDLAACLPALALVWNRRVAPEVPWRTPFEADADGPALADYEMEQFRDSVEYLRGLEAPSPVA